MIFFRFANDRSIGGPNCLSKMMLPNFSHGYQSSLKSKYHWTVVLSLDGITINPLLTGTASCRFQTVITESGVADTTAIVIWSDEKKELLIFWLSSPSRLIISFQLFQRSRLFSSGLTSLAEAPILIAREIRTVEGNNNDKRTINNENASMLIMNSFSTLIGYAFILNLAGLCRMLNVECWMLHVECLVFKYLSIIRDVQVLFWRSFWSLLLPTSYFLPTSAWSHISNSPFKSLRYVPTKRRNYPLFFYLQIVVTRQGAIGLFIPFAV